MRSPDFFLVGAPKCGTTALYAMLGAHPEVFLSAIKEPDFFAADIRAAVRGRRESGESSIDDWSQYLELFGGAGPAQRIGEGSVSYLASRVAAAAIHERCPDARILMVLRDPADRLFSHYAAAVAARSTRLTFSKWVGDVTRRETLDAAPIGPVVASRYGAHLRRYLTVFPASRIHVVWHEEFVSDAETTLRRIFAFLDVDETQPVPVTIRRNETRVPRRLLPRGAAALARRLPDVTATRFKAWFTVPSSLRPSSADRALAIRLYEDDIRVLTGLTGRDLSRWIAVKR